MSKQRRLYLDPNLQVIFSVTLMAVLGVSSITPVLPNVAFVFERTPQSVALVIAVFTFPGVIFTPILGILGDRIGRKIVLIPSLLAFAITGVACGFARDFDLLLAFRFIQGTGAAAIGAINVTLIGDLFTGEKRAAAMGYNASVLSVGTGLYPAIGGALAAFAWYYPFFLPILALPVAVAVVTVLDYRDPKPRGDLGEYVRATFKVIWHPQVLLISVVGIVTFVLVYGPFLAYLPFLLEESFSASSVAIGLVVAATSISTAAVSFRLGYLAKKFGTHNLVRFAFVLYAVSLAGIPLAKSYPLLAIPILLFGAANGINIPSFLTILTGYSPPQYRAAFMSLNGTVLRIGQTLGPVVAGIGVAILGLKGSFYAGAILAACMLVLLVALKPEPEGLEIAEE